MNIHAKLLRMKLLWLFLLFALVPMLLIALYSYYNIKNQIISSDLSHLEAIAKLKSLQIENFYNESENDIQTIKNSPYTVNIISTGSSSQSSHYKETKSLYEQQLNEYIFNHEINEVYIIRLDGSVLASAKKVKENKFTLFHKLAFEEGKTKIFFSNIYRKDTLRSSIDKNKSYFFTASAPILDYNNKPIGVVVAEFSADNFFDLIQDYSGLGSSGETLLGKKMGDKVIFINPLRHDLDAGMKKSVLIDGPIARPFIMGATKHNGSGSSIDYRGVDVLAAWRYVPISNWGMVAKIDKDEALKPLESIRNSIALTALMLITFGVIASLRITHNIIRPVDNLETEAHIDALTGLPNRKQLMEILEQALNKAKLNDKIVAVMFLDLDGFKSINDNHGHEMGDLLLKNTALRLTNCIRQSDTVARLGGDEFIILLCGAQDISNITKIANNIIQTLNEEFSLNGSIATIGASIGISIFPKSAANADEMLRQADNAMYEAKKSGKNNFKFTCDL
ncbi:MAG: diguanylate cyclase [Sulfuricurvum sp.]|nr:diguanylate cyclase [Sulfuricurvum sp.]MDD5386209.1 diguanylate cyclase [Sulfuricurvum sp.]